MENIGGTACVWVVGTGHSRGLRTEGRECVNVMCTAGGMFRLVLGVRKTRLKNDPKLGFDVG